MFIPAPENMMCAPFCKFEISISCIENTQQLELDLHRGNGKLRLVHMGSGREAHQSN
jgi:hypothetical protein